MEPTFVLLSSIAYNGLIRIRPDEIEAWERLLPTDDSGTRLYMRSGRTYDIAETVEEVDNLVCRIASLGGPVRPRTTAA